MRFNCSHLGFCKGISKISLLRLSLHVFMRVILQFNRVDIQWYVSQRPPEWYYLFLVPEAFISSIKPSILHFNAVPLWGGKEILELYTSESVQIPLCLTST